MIGYSDSGKDAGRLAAAWGLYVVQARLPPHAPAYCAPCPKPYANGLLPSSEEPSFLCQGVLRTVLRSLANVVDHQAGPALALLQAQGAA